MKTSEWPEDKLLSFGLGILLWILLLILQISISSQKLQLLHGSLLLDTYTFSHKVKNLLLCQSLTDSIEKLLWWNTGISKHITLKMLRPKLEVWCLLQNLRLTTKLSIMNILLLEIMLFFRYLSINKSVYGKWTNCLKEPPLWKSTKYSKASWSNLK